jgi:hypothetical protein
MRAGRQEHAQNTTQCHAFWNQQKSALDASEPALRVAIPASGSTPHCSEALTWHAPPCSSARHCCCRRDPESSARPSSARMPTDGRSCLSRPSRRGIRCRSACLQRAPAPLTRAPTQAVCATDTPTTITQVRGGPSADCRAAPVACARLKAKRRTNARQMRHGRDRRWRHRLVPPPPPPPRARPRSRRAAHKKRIYSSTTPATKRQRRRLRGPGSRTTRGRRASDLRAFPAR